MLRQASIAKVFLPGLLAILLVAPSLALLVFHQVQMQAHRKQVKNHLLAHTPRSELVRLSFSRKAAAQLRWEHQHEFEYRGEMYDVVERKVQGDSLVLWCWLDNEETRLYQKFESLLAHQQPQPTEDDLVAGSWQQLQKLWPPTYGHIPAKAEITIKKYIPTHSPLAQLWLTVVTPPPRKLI